MAAAYAKELLFSIPSAKGAAKDDRNTRHLPWHRTSPPVPPEELDLDIIEERIGDYLPADAVLHINHH